MKKIFILVLLVLVGISLFNLPNLKADESRSITRKSTVVTADSVVSAQGVTVYKVNGYANASNSVYALCNTSTVAGVANSNIKVESGEATQYDGLPPLEWKDGLEFPSGLTVILDGAYLTIEYE